MPEGLVLWGVKNIYYVLDAESGKEFKCVIKGKVIETDFNIKGRWETNPIVVGDKVLFEKVDNENGVITKRLDRRNEFKRLKSNGRVVQTIFANIDFLVVIDSVAHPPIRPYFIDRCLFTAEYMNIPAVIVINKIDLLDNSFREELKKIIKIYQKLNYKIFETSAIDNTGLDEFKDFIKDKIISFNGRSGVGKSSLIKALDPEYADIKTSEINKKYDRGIHTTTYSKIYKMNFGAKIIDTPGIRELAVYADNENEVEKYIRDFDDFRDECKFDNCQHINEPGCRVLKALNDNEIDPFRYESYIRIRNTVEKLDDSRI
jgi:ribosome biogenesis GTPase